jgi:hypothetical protein
MFLYLHVHVCIVILNWVTFILYSSFIIPLEYCFSWHTSWKGCCVCLHMTSRFYEIDIGCIVVNEIDVILKLLTWARKYNILFHKNKTICYYLNLFSWKYLLSYLCWLSTSGFKCQRQNIFSLARPTREIVHQYVIYRNEDLCPLLLVSKYFIMSIMGPHGAIQSTHLIRCIGMHKLDNIVNVINILQ